MNISKFVVSTVWVLISSCATYKPSQDYIVEKNYKDKSVLKKSILEGSRINESDVQKILNSRVKLPKKMKIAVLRTRSSITSISYASASNSLKTNNLDHNLVNNFYKVLENNSNILEVIPVPPTLVSDNINIDDMRSLAIRMQAHIILVVDANSDLNTDFVFIEGTKAKSITTADGYLIDVVTGVILTSGTYTETAEVFKNSSDYDNFEVMKRAKQESEIKVFTNIAKDISVFLKKAQL